MTTGSIANPTLRPSGSERADSAPSVSEGARQREKLKKACQEFEAVFVGMLLKQMRKSMTGGNALFGNSSEAKLYQDMMDDATASQMSKTGSLGLANVLYKTLEATLPPEIPAGQGEQVKPSARSL